MVTLLWIEINFRESIGQQRAVLGGELTLRLAPSHPLGLHAAADASIMLPACFPGLETYAHLMEN
jgi:hypothetical protein